jgi:hypothetical protein
MNGTVPDRATRALRSPAPILLIALALAWSTAGIRPEARDTVVRSVHAGHADAALPAGSLAHRGLDLHRDDRSREDRSPGVRRAGRRSGPATASGDHGRATASVATEGSARRALQRAGRNSAPSTAPPLPS